MLVIVSKFQDINDFVSENQNKSVDKIKVIKPLPKLNQLMHDLGLFHAHTKSDQVIKKKISDLDHQFDLGMILVIFIEINTIDVILYNNKFLVKMILKF